MAQNPWSIETSLSDWSFGGPRELVVGGRRPCSWSSGASLLPQFHLTNMGATFPLSSIGCSTIRLSSFRSTAACTTLFGAPTYSGSCDRISYKLHVPTSQCLWCSNAVNKNSNLLVSFRGRTNCVPHGEKHSSKWLGLATVAGWAGPALAAAIAADFGRALAITCAASGSVEPVPRVVVGIWSTLGGGIGGGGAMLDELDEDPPVGLNGCDLGILLGQMQRFS